MKRPDFSPEEEKLIDRVRHHSPGQAQVLSFYVPLLLVATTLFAIGISQQHIESALTGFILATFFLLRFVVYQVKAGSHWKTIVDKYEKTFQEQ